MRNESKWLVVFVVVVVVVMAAVAIHFSGDDSDDSGFELGIPPKFYQGSITVQSFHVESEGYGTWVSGVATIYRSEDGFEGDIVLQYYEDPKDPFWIELDMYSEFQMTEVRTDHIHPDGQCHNVATMSWYDGQLSNAMLIEQYHDCPYRDDGTITIHIKSTDNLDSEQTCYVFLVNIGGQANAFRVSVDLPPGDERV